MRSSGGPVQELLGELRTSQVSEALVNSGLWLDLGAVTVHVRSNCTEFAEQLQQTYPAFPVVCNGEWADVHVDIRSTGGLRRWVGRQASFWCDGASPFEPFPADSALPLFEWGCNWVIGQRANNLLLLHAGAVERDGLALVMPAVPGSGKSTLTAALAMRGWRLLSDEFGAYDPHRASFCPMLKPVALKNRSIEVIRRFAPDATLGPVFAKTRKGDVAHLASPPQAVGARGRTAAPGAFLLPKWQSGSETRLEPLVENRLFSALAFNAFNYGLLGLVGFRSVVDLVRRCPGWQLVYSDLDEAVAAIDRLWPEVRSHHAGRQP